jgi:type II secretion system (T2SS) protein M
MLVGGALVACMLLGARGLPAAYLWQRELHANALESRTALYEARILMNSESMLRESTIVRGKRVIDLAPLLLNGDSPSASGATLEGVLSQAAMMSKVQLGAVELQSDSGGKTIFEHVAVRASANGDIRGLTNMLAQLERGPALLSIKQLSITQPEMDAGLNRMESLHMELVVEGISLFPTVKHSQ